MYREGVEIFSSRGDRYPLQPLVQPPSLIDVLVFWNFLATHTRLPLQFWMRLSCALADAGSLWVVWRIAAELPALRVKPSTLMLLAACPVSILISGFHGNIDPIMIFFLVASTYLIETKRSLAFAGILMGLALGIKVMPVILMPAVLLYLPGWKPRLRFAFFAGSALILAGLPYTATDTWLILHAIAGYSSMPSVWLALSRLAGISLVVDKGLFVASLVFLSIGMNRSRPRFPLFAQCGLLISVALFLAPGFGVQYLAWAVPWIAFLGSGATLAYYLTAGTFLFVAYTHWSGGFPWYRAESLDMSAVGLTLWLFCWYVVGITLVLYIKAWRERRLHPLESGSSEIEIPVRA